MLLYFEIFENLHRGPRGAGLRVQPRADALGAPGRGGWARGFVGTTGSKPPRGQCRRPLSLATVARATTARCRGVVRAACRLLAGRCASAAARRGLASRLLCAVQLWRKTAVPITCTNAGCWSMLVPAHRDLLCRGALGPALLAHRASLHSAAFNCTLPTQATKDFLALQWPSRLRSSE